MNPKYPIYIISKGRHDKCLTAIEFNIIGVPFMLVVEPQEFDLYAGIFGADKIHVLPFSNLGQGSIPARNWVMNHSISIGAQRHWIMDDNIRGFFRYNNNRKSRVQSGTILRCAEDFTDRYENIGISGLQYFKFIIPNNALPAYHLNTRIYSMILMNNAIGYRWRGRYNEDTDISLRVLKDGWCTILFNAFIGEKITTQTMGGGNTNGLYEKTNKRKEFAESLKEQHPDIVNVVWRYNRWHHEVDYSGFTQKLIRKPGLEIPDRVNNYGMVLIERGDPRWIKMGNEKETEKSE